MTVIDTLSLFFTGATQDATGGNVNRRVTRHAFDGRKRSRLNATNRVHSDAIADCALEADEYGDTIVERAERYGASLSTAPDGVGL